MNPILDPLMNLPLLTADEEKALARRRDAGDRTAVDELVIRNQRLVFRVAMQFKDRGGDLRDLVSAGQIGLIRAAEKFDAERNRRFSTYATRWLRQAMQTEFEFEVSPIFLPSHARHNVKSNALSGECHVIGKRIMAAKFLSFDAANDGDGTGDSLHPSYSEADSRMEEMEHNRERAREAISQLKESHRDIIIRLYGLDGNPPMTGREIAAAIGTTHQNVSQLKDRAIGLLQKIIQDQNAA